MADKFEFRSVFNKNTINTIASNIDKVYPNFKKQDFISSTLTNFESLSFGDRNSQITDNLHIYLPQDFPTALSILVNSLGNEIQEEEIEGYEGFYVMPLSTYVSRYGTEYYEISIQALIAMTKRFTSEFAIRTFFILDEEKTLEHLHNCTKSDNCHVRRLASEGSRPRLPLGSRLHSFVKDPKPVLRLLNALKNEPTRLVQRSIANNLNDIAKDNPDAVVTFLEQWQKEKVKDVEWIIKHATRTLVKEGHSGTLKLLGFNPDIKIKTSSLQLMTPTVVLGESLSFKATVAFENSNTQKVVIDYLLYFKKANGQLKPKVFKLTSKSILPNTTLTLQKKHPIKLATTRKYYAGEQAIQLQVNGKLVGEKKYFHLSV